MECDDTLSFWMDDLLTCGSVYVVYLRNCCRRYFTQVWELGVDGLALFVPFVIHKVKLHGLAICWRSR